MSRQRYVAGRVAWAAVATYVVVTLLFLLVAVAPDDNVALQLWAMAVQGADPHELNALQVALQQERPLHERYASWMTAVLTFDWGESTSQEQLVTTVLATRAPVTLAFAVPGAVLSFLGAATAGYVAASRRTSVTDRAVTASSYAVLSVPNFLLAAVLVTWARVGDAPLIPTGFDAAAGVAHTENLLWLTLPTVVLATHLFAIHVRFARAESLEYLQATFMKVVRSKGAGQGRIARHTFRNAAVPLVTLFVVEVLDVMLVTVFVVEAVFGLPGLGHAAFVAVQEQDMALLLVLVLLTAVVIIVGNLLQDLAYAALDPRVRTSE